LFFSGYISNKPAIPVQFPGKILKYQGIIAMMYQKGSIRYDVPDIMGFRESGYYPADMHLHTCHSDGMFRIPDLITYAEKHQFGVAITDHNEISGVIEAVSLHPDIMVIPGIELETREGPHLLMYFYSAGDLEEYFRELNRERSRQISGLYRNLPVSECLTLAGTYDCLRVAAHPFGYYGINRGVLKCVEKNMLPGVLDYLDGIEAVCGGMPGSLNRRATRYAQEHSVPFTGGSDAHILSEVGSVITGTPAGTVEEFLASVRRRENVVVGRPGGYLAKSVTAGVIAWSFVPYTVSQLGSRYTVHRHRTSRIFSRCKGKIPALRGHAGEKGGESEERGENTGN
jgi:predicted metal-dependent phosphoesterase TrpH